jgi:hypothetical protein
MRIDKENAKTLRTAGKSYKEISEELNISKSTLSGWFAKEEWSNKVRIRLTQSASNASRVRILGLNKVRGENLKRVYEDARNEARKEFETLKYNPLFIACLMLYWGEGDKVTPHVVKLTNTDVEMVKLFSFFLREICAVPLNKIRAQVLVYPDLNEEECKKYWSSGAGISSESFIKSTLIQGRHKTKRLGHGVCMVFVSSTYFKVKILEWLSLLPGELMKEEYYASI